MSSEARSRLSAGLLMFRRAGVLEVLLVHPGGPFFRRKDEGVWTIPKGEATPGEDLLTRARIEFEEELGIAATEKNWISLGEIKQKGGKVVHAWAFEADLPDGFVLKSNVFTIEWPPRGGRMAEFPEVDRAEFFSDEVARVKINPAQIPLLDRLRAALVNE
ncbi:MAG: NUDIX domain-containing protein [Chthoniobacterales bacterium]